MAFKQKSNLINYKKTVNIFEKEIALCQNNSDFTNFNQELDDLFNDKKIKRTKVLLSIDQLLKCSFDLYSPYTQKKRSSFFDELLNTKISVYKRVDHKQF